MLRSERYPRLQLCVVHSGSKRDRFGRRNRAHRRPLNRRKTSEVDAIVRQAYRDRVVRKRHVVVEDRQAGEVVGGGHAAGLQRDYIVEELLLNVHLPEVVTRLRKGRVYLEKIAQTFGRKILTHSRYQ